MKILHLSIILISISLLIPLLLNNTANGCLFNSDWPHAPCYAIPGINATKEQMQKDWSGYLQYKGNQWMELKKNEMSNATATGTLKNWVCNSESNYDVWWYYYLNNQAPSFIIPTNGPFCDEHHMLSPLKQFKSGIALKNIACAPNLQLVIKANSRSPECVKPSDVFKLVERGWADKPNSLQEQLDFANSCTGMTDACMHRYDAKNSNPLGVTALIIYHPPDLCLNTPAHSIPSGLPSCPPNNFYLKINSNSTAYLMGYNICDGNSCATNNTWSLILPLNAGLNPDYQMIG